ncbi:hypothetical protein D3C75_591710 [compost metagenome]
MPQHDCVRAVCKRNVGRDAFVGAGARGFAGRDERQLPDHLAVHIQIQRGIRRGGVADAQGVAPGARHNVDDADAGAAGMHVPDIGAA